jgi:HlyD family secretion protein
MFTKIKDFIKRPRNYILTGIAVIILLFIIFGRGSSGNTFQTATASISTLQQEVSATGRVKSAQNVDLVFEIPGKIAWIPVKVGQKVVVGQTLMSLDIGELNAQLQSAQANIRAAQAKYDQLVNGARAEDLAIYQNNYNNAKSALASSLKSAIDTTIGSMTTFSDIRYKYSLDNNVSLNVKDTQDEILFRLYGQRNMSGSASYYFNQVNNILDPRIDQFLASADGSGFEQLPEDVKSVLFLSRDSLSSAINYLSSTTSSDADKLALNNARANVLTQISSVLTSLSSYKNAQDQLTLKKAPATDYDLQIAQSQLEQARASFTSVQSQISKKILRAPISGTVANINGNVGEISNAAKPAISLISNSKYEIEVNISEADIAKIKVGDEATITVDAYGSDVSWPAKVVQIYPSESIIDGVATYETVLQFEKVDDRILSGMTANIDIVSEKKEGVLAIPQRAVIRNSEGKFVKVLVEKKDDGSVDSQFANLNSVFSDNKIAVYEVPVETGIRGVDGRIEITSGLSEGEKVVTN